MNNKELKTEIELIKLTLININESLDKLMGCIDKNKDKYEKAVSQTYEKRG